MQSRRHLLVPAFFWLGDFMSALPRFSVFAFSILLSVPAVAAQRTFVSSKGLDTNACSLVAPCRSFAQALTVTDANGEIIVIDSAGYGSVTIDRSVSLIAAPGIYAGVSVFPGTNGVDIATPLVKVVLRGLAINGQGGNIGINFTNGAELHIENCVVSNMGSDGIDLSAAGSHVFIEDTIVRNNGQSGIGFLGTVTAHLDRVRSEGNGDDGVSVLTGSRVSINDSELVSNGVNGLFAESLDASLTRVAISNSTISGNTLDGIQNFGGIAGSRVETSAIRNTISKNTGNGAFASGSGVSIITATDNLVTGNGAIGLVADGLGASIVSSGNTVTKNGQFGLSQVAPAVFQTRSDNMVSGNNGGGGQTSGVITTLGGL
jgi:parallel beta helix pectate lyase-like protein